MAATNTAVDVVMPQMGVSLHGGNQVSPMDPLLNGVIHRPLLATPGEARLRRVC
jgi:hypothetical protein